MVGSFGNTIDMEDGYMEKGPRTDPTYQGWGLVKITCEEDPSS